MGKHLNPKDSLIHYLWLSLCSPRAHCSKCWLKFSNSGRVDPPLRSWNHLSGRHATTCSHSIWEKFNKLFNITKSHHFRQEPSSRLSLLVCFFPSNQHWLSLQVVMLKNLQTSICSKLLLWSKVVKRKIKLKYKMFNFFLIFHLQFWPLFMKNKRFLVYTLFQWMLSFTFLHFSTLSGPSGVLRMFRRR